MRNAEREESIMAYINEHGARTAEQLCAVVHAGRDAMGGLLNNLVREGRLIAIPPAAGARQVHPAYGLPSIKPKYDPADPFGLVAKRAEELVVEKVAEMRETPAEEVAEKPEVTTILDHGFEPVEAGHSVVIVPRAPEPPSPLAQRYRTTPEAEVAASNFVVALLSDSSLELRIDGKTVTLKKSEWTHMREFINKVEAA